MDVTESKRVRKRCREFLVAGIATLVAQCLWAAGPKIAFDIPAGDLSQSIIRFYKQSQVEILYASLDGAGQIRTNPVIGELEISDALRKMLEGTGYTFEFENPRSVLLKRMHLGGAVIGNEAAIVTAASGDLPAGSPAQSLVASDSFAPQDVIVTGTFIHGVLDIMSPLLHVEKKQMRNTGYATVHDALQALPINSGAGPSDDFGSTGNYNRGTAPNLRGLGYGATLVLVNGRRQPLAGSDADFVDTSNIPWSAVERIEVLPDGTSALYGSDAIAGVVNIIMRDDLQGAETQGRFASLSGSANETVVAQLFGHRWDSGKWLLSYQYSQRNELAAADRSYAISEDKRPLGGSDHRVFWGSPGNILDPVTWQPAFAIPAGQDGTALEFSDLLPGQINLHDRFSAYDLTPDRKLHSAYLSASQQLGDRFELYGEARLAERSSEQRQYQADELLIVPSSNAFFVEAYDGMPFVLMAYSFLEDLGPTVFEGKTRSFDGMLGLKADLGSDWRANLQASYGRESLRWDVRNMINPGALEAALADDDPVTAFNPFGDGSHTNPETLESIRMTERSRVASDIAIANLIADGPVFTLPSGETRLAVGVESRKESLRHHLARLDPARYSRDVSSAFAELSVPLVGRIDDPHSIPRLELSLAARYEEYSDFGDTFNPKVGLRWAPVPWGKVRTSWGTSFKAPKLLDLYDTSQNLSGMLLMQDPRSDSGQSIVLVRQGNNPNLDEETARTWTLGLDIMPRSLNGLTMSVTYYDIAYEGRTLRPGPPNPFDILLQESQWQAVIDRHPSRSEIGEICSDPNFLGSPASCAASSPAAIIDYRLRNLAITRTRGVDLKIDYSLGTRGGDIDFGLSGNRVFEFRQAFTPTAPMLDIVDTVGNPLGVRFRATADWYRHGRRLPGPYAGVTVDHTGGYRDNESVVHPAVEAYTSLDLRVGYLAGRTGWMNGVDVFLNAVNVLDTAPPFVDRSLGYDTANADPIGRSISLYVQKSW